MSTVSNISSSVNPAPAETGNPKPIPIGNLDNIFAQVQTNALKQVNPNLSADQITGLLGNLDDIRNQNMQQAMEILPLPNIDSLKNGALPPLPTPEKLQKLQALAQTGMQQENDVLTQAGVDPTKFRSAEIAKMTESLKTLGILPPLSKDSLPPPINITA